MPSITFFNLPGEKRERLLAAARADKKRRGNAITLIQPREPGECVLFRTDYGELARVLELGM